MAIARTKDPVLVEAGRRGARSRWGSEPRVVRIADLTPPQRRLVLALIAAARAEPRTPVEAA
jgi:hypothetical protein